MTHPPKVYSYLRFSSPEQLKGDSLRRQLERSHKWCKENGLTLDESLTMQDLGLSAYSGAHKTKGALGSFLKAVEAGTVSAGSILLVESLDRLSRQDVVDAQTQFLNIINSNIEIVTLMDGYRYSRDSISENWTQLVISLTIMSRANEESKTKADRLNNVWAAKRNNAAKKPMTSVCPAWLKLNKRTDSFDLNEKLVEVVKRIFNLYLAGNGVYRICSILNDENIPTFGKSEIWRISSTQAILKNRAVMGEYQPHRSIRTETKRQRIPDGDPIKDYYPAIIDPETFYAVQTGLAARAGKGGQKGKVRNLFTHAAVCGVCGGKAHFVNKGKWQYLRCENSFAANRCDASPWAYPDFEFTFLTQCAELDVSAILPSGNGRAAKINAAQLAVDAVKGELADNEKLVANATKIIDTSESEAVLKMYEKKLADALANKEVLEKKLSDAQMAFHMATAETASTDEQLKSLKGLILRLETTEGSALIQLRAKVKNAIASLVNRILIFSDGLKDKIVLGNAIDGWTIGEIQDEYDPVDQSEAINAYVNANTGKEHRAVLIEFKTGGYRLLKRQDKEYLNIVSTEAAIKELISA